MFHPNFGRHARARPGHPRLAPRRQVVDPRAEPGEDVERGAPRHLREAHSPPARQNSNAAVSELALASASESGARPWRSAMSFSTDSVAYCVWST